MAPTIAHAVSEFLNSLTGIFFSLLNSILAVLQAFIVLGKDVLSACVQLVQSVISFGTGLLQGAFGFVAANFLALAVIGGGYYIYTTGNKKGTGKRRA